MNMKIDVPDEFRRQQPELLKTIIAVRLFLDGFDTKNNETRFSNMNFNSLDDGEEEEREYTNSYGNCTEASWFLKEVLESQCPHSIWTPASCEVNGVWDHMVHTSLAGFPIMPHLDTHLLTQATVKTHSASNIAVINVYDVVEYRKNYPEREKVWILDITADQEGYAHVLVSELKSDMEINAELQFDIKQNQGKLSRIPFYSVDWPQKFNARESFSFSPNKSILSWWNKEWSASYGRCMKEAEVLIAKMEFSSNSYMMP